MLCWHLVLLLNKLQIKHVGPFEHLRSWRDLVGIKSKDKSNGDKPKHSSYKVKKERRLRSFIEIISKRMKTKVEKMAKEKGVKLN